MTRFLFCIDVIIRRAHMRYRICEPNGWNNEFDVAIS